MAQVLVVLDISVVNPALPTIGADLELSSGDPQWLVTAYPLMSGGGLLLGGRIADPLSRRRVLLTGLKVFTTASLVSGFASTAGVLIGARAAQGLGAALMTPAALAIIMTTYAGAQRAKGFAMWGAVGGLGIAAGVLVGGVITTWAGWQAIFWVNVPIGAGAVVAALVLLPRTGPARSGLAQLDLPGAVAAVTGLGALVFGIQTAASDGWASPKTVGALAVSGLLLSAFGVHRAAGAATAGAAAHLAYQDVGLRDGCDARGHRAARRGGLSRFDLLPDDARLLRVGGGTGVPAAGR
ncbi:MAG TPA: MFS transporter [Mycobacterium sp.]